MLTFYRYIVHEKVSKTITFKVQHFISLNKLIFLEKQLESPILVIDYRR